MDAALVAILPSELAKGFIDRIRKHNASAELAWSHSFTKEMETEIKRTISEKGYARVFLYETKKTGGSGIRLALHIEDMSDILHLKLRCLVDICRTKFHIVGYELFKPPLQLGDLIHFRTKTPINPRMISGNLAIAEEIDAKGIDLSVLYRLKWNDGGWQGPAGIFSENVLVPSEEWNLKAKDSVNGYIYAFFETRPKRFGEGVPFPLHLWSESPTDGYVLVGRFERAETVEREELEWVDHYFETKGIYDQRAAELIDTYSALDPAWTSRVPGSSREEKLAYLKSGMRDVHTDPTHVIKCPVDSIKVFENPVKFDTYLRKLITKAGGWQYKKPWYIKSYPVILNPEEHTEVLEMVKEESISSEATRKRTGRRGTTTSPSGEERTRKGQSGVVVRMEEAKLVDRFRSWLAKERTIPLDESHREHDYVDVSFDYRGKHYAVEAKFVYSTTTTAIRNAIGQLLDYNLHPSFEGKSDVWLILLDKKPSAQDFKWLSDMRKRFTEAEFPVYACWESSEGFEVESDVL